MASTYFYRRPDFDYDDDFGRIFTPTFDFGFGTNPFDFTPFNYPYPESFGRDTPRNTGTVTQDEDYSFEGIYNDREYSNDYGRRPPYHRRRNRNRGGGGGRRGGRALVANDDFKSNWLPDWDVMNSDKEIVVVMEVPGIPKDQIKVNVEEGRLVISSARPTDEKLAKSDNVILREREFGTFKRRVRLPQGCNASKISAKQQNGILEVHVPKDTTDSGVRVDIK